MACTLCRSAWCVHLAGVLRGSTASTARQHAHTHAHLANQPAACRRAACRAGQQGGAIYSAINDVITWHLLDLINSTLLNNSAGTQGGGIFMLGGLTGIQGTSIVSNHAGQQVRAASSAAAK
jgi:predicted outer membrane repeat protein